MRKYRPSGPPPPYHTYSTTPGAPPVAYAYVPTPIYPPTYDPLHPVASQSQPPYATYVTNIYQQSDPEPATVSNMHKPIFAWVPANHTTARSLAHKAVVAGKEGWDGSPLWVIRAHHNGECVPGKLAIKHKAAYIPHAGREVPVLNFEVMTCTSPDALHWLPSSHGQVPVGGITAGNTRNGETLYIARAQHKGSITPGKVHPSHRCCYISFGGKELPFTEYEVLCKVVG